jgi:hypothetical protein
MAMLMLMLLSGAMFYGTGSERITFSLFVAGMMGFDPIDVSTSYR